MSHSGKYSLRPIGLFQFIQNTFGMATDSFLAYTELFGDLFVRIRGGHLFQDFEFTWSQRN